MAQASAEKLEHTGPAEKERVASVPQREQMASMPEPPLPKGKGKKFGHLDLTNINTNCFRISVFYAKNSHMFHQYQYAIINVTTICLLSSRN